MKYDSDLGTHDQYCIQMFLTYAWSSVWSIMCPVAQTVIPVFTIEYRTCDQCHMQMLPTYSWVSVSSALEDDLSDNLCGNYNSVSFSDN